MSQPGAYMIKHGAHSHKRIPSYVGSQIRHACELNPLNHMFGCVPDEAGDSKEPLVEIDSVDEEGQLHNAAEYEALKDLDELYLLEEVLALRQDGAFVVRLGARQSHPHTCAYEWCCCFLAYTML